MYLLEPKKAILSLLSEVPESMQGRVRQPKEVSAKINQVGEILSQNKELREAIRQNPNYIKEMKLKIKESPADLTKDPEVVGKILLVTEKSRDRDVQKFGRDLLFKAYSKEESPIVKIPEFIDPRVKSSLIHSIPQDKGRFDEQTKTLTLTEKALNQIDQKEFWSFLEKESPQKLIIRKEDGKTIIYEEKVIKQLIDKRLPVYEDEVVPTATCRIPLQSLFEMSTLKFPGGEELVDEPNAKLFLCGDEFYELYSQMNKADNVLDFSDFEVTLETFLAILTKIETGEKDPKVSDELYAIACNLFKSSFEQKLPEGVFGPKDYEHYWGIKLKDAPPCPQDYIDFMNDKEVSKDWMCYLVVPLDLDQLKKHAKNPKKGHATEEGFRYINEAVKKACKKEENKIKAPYWVLKTRGVLPGSQGLTREALLKKVAELGAEAPSVLEEAIGELTWYVRTGERLMEKDKNGNWVFTCCRDKPAKGDMSVVGGFSAAGPYVYYDCVNDYVGVAALRRK